MKRSQVLEIKRQALAGKNAAEIAAEMNKNPETIRRWLRALRAAGHEIPRGKRKYQKLDLTNL